MASLFELFTDCSKTLSHRSQPTSDESFKSAFAVASATHVGMRRRNNQDNLLVQLAEDESSWAKFGHLLIVADGMGAHAAGELASRLSVELIPHHYQKICKGNQAEALQQSLIETNAEIYRRGQANPEFRSMGTTTCALTICPEGAIVAHVGDSRVYRLRGQQFEQLTFDHSLVWEMRATGDLTEEALRNSSIPKNVITRSLGPNASVMVDVEGPFPLKTGDKFLLCSDGLSGQLRDEELGVLLQVLDIDAAVQVMVDLANLRGGPDNITVIVGEVRNGSLIKNQQERSSGSESSKGSYPIPFGVASAVGLLLSLALIMLGQFPIALVAMAAAAAAFATGWIKYQSSPRVPMNYGGMHGKGPYRKTSCKTDSSFTRNLSEVVSDLEGWFQENNWSKNTEKISKLLDGARKADASKNFSEAIRLYAETILAMMHDARRHEKSDDTKDQSSDEEDGAIDY